MNKDKNGNIQGHLDEKQKEQVKKLFMSLRNGEGVFLNDNNEFEKGEFKLDDDDEDPVSRDDTSYI